jgi:hypothetical protein
MEEGSIVKWKIQILPRYLSVGTDKEMKKEDNIIIIMMKRKSKIPNLPNKVQLDV